MRRLGHKAADLREQASQCEEGVDQTIDTLFATFSFFYCYCNNVPFSASCLASSGGMTTAAATLSSDSRLSNLTPCVERPASRMLLVSMRMILPYWLITISSEVSSTS